MPGFQVYWMCRLIALFVKYAVTEGFYAPSEDVPADHRPAHDPTEGGGVIRQPKDCAGDECEGSDTGESSRPSLVEASWGR